VAPIIPVMRAPARRNNPLPGCKSSRDVHLVNIDESLIFKECFPYVQGWTDTPPGRSCCQTLSLRPDFQLSDLIQEASRRVMAQRASDASKTIDEAAAGPPLRRLQTKEQQVAEFLRESILAGVFARGQKLKQAEIAKYLDISITPVREAIKLLEAEGYVHNSAHRGAVVAPFQIERVDELFQLRLAMEPKLTLAAARLLTARDIDELSAIDSLLREAAHHTEQESKRRGYNYRFHFRLYECAELPQTLQFVHILWAKYPFDMLGALPNRAEQVAQDHASIMEALRTRNARAAMQAMQKHMESGHRLFKTYYSLGMPRER
jgi:DNA-binding GntR family transcriptional regulator